MIRVPQTIGAGLTLILLTTLLPTAGALRPGAEVAPAAGRLLLWHLELAFLLVVVWWVGPSRSGRGRPDGSASVALGLLAAWTLVSAALAPYGYAAWLGLLEVGAFAALWWLAARQGAPPGPALAGTLLAAAAAESTLALWQRFGTGGARPGGTFENPNHLAGWLVAVAALNAPLLLSAKGSRGPRVARAAGCLLAVVAMLLTGSRGAALGLGVATLWLLAVAFRGLGRRARWAALGVVALVAAGVGVRLAQRLEESDPFRYQRLRIWRACAQAVLDAPLTGVGPRQFRAASERFHFPDGHGPLRFDRGFYRTHSDLLRLAVELGVPGVLLLAAFLLLSVRAVRRSPRSIRGSPSALGASAALLALATQALVENLSEQPALYVLAAVLLGGLVSRPLAQPLAAGRDASLAMRAFACIALISVVLVGDVGPYLAWRRASVLPFGRLSDRQRERLDGALRLNPIQPDLWLRRARDLASEPGPRDAPVYAAAREAAEHAIRLQPADARYRAGLAQVEARACRTLFPDLDSRERTARRFLEAEALAPHNPRWPLERAKFLLAMEDPAGARRAAERVLAIEPNAVEARLVLADALLEAGAPGAVSRAGRLVAEARELSIRFADVRAEGEYAAAMLGLDPTALDRVERKIAATAP